MTFALEEVKKQVDDFKNLPGDAEDPQVTQLVRYESVARFLISGTSQIDELRLLARRFEQELIDAGIDKVEIRGLPKQQLKIELAAEQMQRLGLGLDELAKKIDAESQDLPAGQIGEEDGAREIRSQNQRRTPRDFASLAIVSEADRRIHLGDIANIEQRHLPGSPTISLAGNNALVLVLRRNESGDSLEAARILQNWLDETRAQLPPGIKLQVFNERWQLIKDRIMLLLKNGAGGLVLVLLILYLFLSTRVAFWVAVGIPVSFMATLAVLYLVGGSINMISLFALIMALGIIVDDAIVVGEDAQAHFDMGEDPLMASEGGARRMLAPVLASSLTTIAAFLPLMLIGGRMGSIMMAIPVVIVCVIVASLIESFLILPGHLRHAFVQGREVRQSAASRTPQSGIYTPARPLVSPPGQARDRVPLDHHRDCNRVFAARRRPVFWRQDRLAVFPVARVDHGLRECALCLRQRSQGRGCFYRRGRSRVAQHHRGYR